MPSRVRHLLEGYARRADAHRAATAPSEPAAPTAPAAASDRPLLGSSGGGRFAAVDTAGAGTSTDPNVDVLTWKPDEVSWSDYLVYLLTMAAEIEHALMVQYLYAAYSLGGEQVPPGHRALVRGWRDVLLTVAREEMGHLLTVQNLLRLLGAPMNLDREDFPWDSRFLPYPFRLEPLTRDSLACYVYAEMPPEAHVPTVGHAYTAFLHEDRRAIEACVAARTDGVLRRTTVDKIYESIIAIVRDEERIPDSAFDGDSYPLQASWDEWGKGYGAEETVPESSGPHTARLSATHGRPRRGKGPRLERDGVAVDPDAPDAVAAGDQDPRPHFDAHVIVPRMASRTEAVAALEDIAGQGEAPHLMDRHRRSHAPHRLGRDPQAGADGGRDVPTEPSHFDRFLGIYQAMGRLERKMADGTEPRWAFARPVPVNPSTVAHTDPRLGCSYIQSETSRRWATLFNLRYRMLLTYLSHAYELPTVAGADHAARAGLLHRTFAEMYNLKALAGIVVRLPLRDGGEGRAGPPFEMPYTLAMPQAGVDRWRLHGELLDGAIDLAARLRAEAPPEGVAYLDALRDLDARSLDWVDERIVGLGAARPARRSRP